MYEIDVLKKRANFPKKDERKMKTEECLTMAFSKKFLEYNFTLTGESLTCQVINKPHPNPPRRGGMRAAKALHMLIWFGSRGN